MRTVHAGAIVALVLAGGWRAQAGEAGAGGEGAPAARKPFSLLAPLPGEVLAPPSSETQYLLKRADDGSDDLSYQSSAFEARIHRDGTVSFRDKTLGSLSLPWLPLQTGRRGPTVQGLLKNLFLVRPGNRWGTVDPPGGDGSGPPVETRAVIPAVTPYRPDPREACRYPNCLFDGKVMLLGITGTFDLTDILMRLNSKDPYRVEKARFLAHTSELRVRLAARAHGDDVRKASASLRAELESIAANQQLSRAERRAILTGLAAELDADTDESRRARAEILEFIRTHFPPTDGGQ